MTIRVGYDYDEPLFPWYDYAHDASVAAGLTTLEQDPPTRWDPHSHYGCSDRAWFDVLDAEILRGRRGMYGRPLKPGVVADMYRLKNRGVEPYIITARGQFGPLGPRIQELTMEQIIVEKVPVKPENVIFTKEKGKAIRDLEIDYFLDDREDYFLQALDNGAEPYLLDERWNQGADIDPRHRLFTTRQYVDLIVARIDSGVLV